MYRGYHFILAINAFELVSKRVAQMRSSSSTFFVLVSQSPEIAYRQASLIFRNRELATNDSLRKILPYIPPASYEECPWVEDDDDDGDWKEINVSRKRKNRSKKISMAIKSNRSK